MTHYLPRILWEYIIGKIMDGFYFILHYPYSLYDGWGASNLLFIMIIFIFLAAIIYKKESAGFITIGQSDMTVKTMICAYIKINYMSVVVFIRYRNYSPHFAFTMVQVDTIAPTLTQIVLRREQCRLIMEFYMFQHTLPHCQIFIFINMMVLLSPLLLISLIIA